MKKILLIAAFALALTTVAFAQGLPTPITDELPLVVQTILGVVAATITEFIQKQKNSLASLGIALGVCVVISLISALILQIPTGDFATFFVTVYALATTTWATLFKGLGVSKKLLKTSA